eukprot:COSAG06_NODE_1201_length_10291_cov_9.960655_1_plen_453_part_00
MKSCGKLTGLTRVLACSLQTRPLELTFIASITELYAQIAIGDGSARAVVNARDGFLRRGQNSNKVMPAPMPPPATMAVVTPEPSRVSLAPAAHPSPRSRTVSDAGTSVHSDFEPDSPAGMATGDISARLDRQHEDAEREVLRIQSELRQVEAQISHLSLLAEPSAPDPVQALAERGIASAADAGIGPGGVAIIGLDGTPLASRGLGGNSRLVPYAQGAPSMGVRARIPSTRQSVQREEFFLQHSAIVETLKEFQKRMSTLDVAQVPLPTAHGGGNGSGGHQPWSVARTIDEEISRAQQDIQRLLRYDGGEWAQRHEFLADVLQQAAGLFQERPVHLRRLTGVAKVSLDNRFTRRAVDRLAQLLHEMNLEILTELRRETARDTAAAAAFVATPMRMMGTTPSRHGGGGGGGDGEGGMAAAMAQPGGGHVSTMMDASPNSAVGAGAAGAPPVGM